MKSQTEQLIVLTGGAGFIGSHVLRHLNAKGFSNIVIFDHLGSTEKWKNLIGKRFYDLLPKSECFDWLKGREKQIKAIIHLGACTSTVETNADYLLENNTRFSIQLAKYALNNDHRFIYASSAATYGNRNKDFQIDIQNIYSLHPLNMYGMSKQLFDQWLFQQGVFDRVVGLKYFNVFGPNEGHKGRMASVIYHMVPIILKEKKVRLFQSSEPKLYADGEQKRDFIYVDDVARMTTAFLDNKNSGLYNIGSGIANTWNDLVKFIFDAVQIPTNIEYIPMPDDLKGKYQNFSQADMTKTFESIGDQSKPTDLKVAVTDYIKNYLLPGKIW